MGWRKTLGNGVAIGILSLPYLLLGLEATRLGFLSNDHAYLIEKALVVRDRGRLEWVGFAYPPLPVLLLLPWPHPWAAAALSGVSAGALALMVWQRLEVLGLPPLVRMGLLLSVMLTPSAVFLASQNFSGMLALLIFFAAWLEYLRFTRGGETDAGFIAAMLMALGFFANFYAPFFAVVFALAAPLFARPRSRFHLLAMLLVLFSPTLLAVGAWMYLSWLFTSDALRFIYDPGSSLLAAFRPDEAFMATQAILAEGVRRLVAAPLYLGVGVLIARYQPARLPAYGIPLALASVAWALGWVVPRAFDQALKLLFALAGIPARPFARGASLPNRGRAGTDPVGSAHRIGWLLLALALAQIVADGPTLASGEPARWWRALRAGPLPEDELEQRIAGELVRVPCGAILTDDREAFRLIARAGTACPFVLPPDPIFEMAAAQPARFVAELLVGERPRGWASPLESRYRDRPPEGFVPDAGWPGWRRYRRAGADAR
jgi:hypothetical protein